MKMVYDVVRIPFGDKDAVEKSLFKPSVIATCKSKTWAQYIIGMQSKVHSYEIKERKVA